MFISKFVRLGARAMKIRAVRAPMFSPATSFSMDHNQYSRDLGINQILNAMDTPKFIKYKNGNLDRHVLFCTTAAKLDSEEGDEEPKRINVTFVDKIGAEMHVKVPEGFSMLEAAQDNDIDLEGACEGSLACSTCHVIVMDVDHYNKLPDPTDEENDMLDLAFGLTDTSRLGCQIIAKPELDGLRLALPSATCNLTL